MLPATGTISIANINTELGYSFDRNISLNDTVLRKLAGRPSGTIYMSDFRGKYGQFSITQTYSQNYPWSPPAAQWYSAQTSSPTTAGLFQGTLNKTGGVWNTYGAWANSGAEYVLINDTTSPPANGSQYGNTWITGAYEARKIVTRSVHISTVNYVKHYRTYAINQIRLITVHQNYSGVVYLRG